MNSAVIRMKSRGVPSLDDERKRLLNVLEQAIIEMRYRIRYDDITTDEIHDMLDAIHNIPEYIRGTSDWHTFTGLSEAIAIFDCKWKPETNPDHAGRRLADAIDRPLD